VRPAATHKIRKSTCVFSAQVLFLIERLRKELRSRSARCKRTKNSSTRSMSCLRIAGHYLCSGLPQLMRDELLKESRPCRPLRCETLRLFWP
jgi:hypothetical protein